MKQRGLIKVFKLYIKLIRVTVVLNSLLNSLVQFWDN